MLIYSATGISLISCWYGSFAQIQLYSRFLRFGVESKVFVSNTRTCTIVYVRGLKAVRFDHQELHMHFGHF